MNYFADVVDVKQFISQQKEDKKWIRSGQVVDTGAKVYGFRVDNVNNETYRMWNGMLRNMEDIDEQEGEESAEESKQQMYDEDGNPIAQDPNVREKKRQNRILKLTDKGGEKTLEQNLKNITMDNFDVQHEKDPLFKQTT